MAFTAESLRFFRQLAAHNDKQWFEAHRGEYDQLVREPMQELVEEMLTRFRGFAPEIGGDPKRSLFRIHADARSATPRSRTRSCPRFSVASTRPCCHSCGGSMALSVYRRSEPRHEGCCSPDSAFVRHAFCSSFICHVDGERNR